MPNNHVDVAMGELIASLSRLEAACLVARLARAAAAVTGAAYAGFVGVDALRREASAIHVHAPPDDPLGVRRWLEESGVLKELATSAATVRLARDVTVGEPGFLAAEVPLATRDHAFVWVAGRGFGDGDEHLLGRFATASGRALEAASGLEAAARLLRGVQAFRAA
ncbi:hypothetical protein FH608_012665 [Nonomuraea phyllanthi]|uniref:Uncharacterized protein n=1 Tax=Nonomuraea phyllanthi TaxID=2219224 RepID=A0A5C4WNG1_9ACTN|nr:hypothetical protein [Nonomuraea phyllanthi]KAB8195220.1 hypothetical protein FH608_012665 [Nonomuraea phyllanthi]QFY10648.1 hypothetical protein GBF35_32165 [Nonomuraea phyllanthi]